MSAITDWLDERRPDAPAELRMRIAQAVGLGDGDRVDEGRGRNSEVTALDRVDALVGAARGRLDVALARPGRVRETAFELLVADALVTYACEAALESERPSEALERIMEVGRPQ